MRAEKYRMSFSTGGLFYGESVMVARLFLEFHDWHAVREAVLSRNLLQSRTMNTARRVYREICSRLKALDQTELDLLVHGTVQEQTYLLWMAVCRRYQFIADFSLEIIRERYITLKTNLYYQDFDSFFNKKMRFPFSSVPLNLKKLLKWSGFKSSS